MKVHNRINLRAQLHEALISQAEKIYGINSATMRGKYFYTNLGLHVSFMLKPLIKP
jgi:hypothetical protein